MWLLQTRAILVDAYRELNAKKLFWAVMAVSGLITAAIACIGFHDTGFSLLGFRVENDMFNGTMIDAKEFYKDTFISFGIRVWLAWGATILAIISTASLIPDFIAGGSIELSLSKPIGRARLFLTKYLSGLIFVLLQVLAFSVVAFMVIGIRGGAWVPGIFLAVPLVTLFFSYLFCVCVLVGVLTRSTIAALLLTILFWLVIFAVNMTDNVLHLFKIRADIIVERHESRIAMLVDREMDRERAIEAYQSALIEAGLSDWLQMPEPTPTAPSDDTPQDAAPTESAAAAAPDQSEELWLPEAPSDSAELRRLRRDAMAAHERLNSSRRYVDRVVRPGLETYSKQQQTWSFWYNTVFTVKTALPKTAETLDLLRRWITDAVNLPADSQEGDANETDAGAVALFAGSSPRSALVVGPDAPEVTIALQRALDQRSVGWVIGTSLIFQFVILGIACLIFARRDF